MNLPKSKKQPLHNYARYSGMAFQMLAIILLGVFAGLKLDGWLHWNKPLFTVVFSLLGVVVAIFTVTHDLLKNK
ncbi:MAG: AtpZ/AtpI family protein [Bacteroidetes bacterium]|nr:AtpZ/AtpI family protein [Bacteroidota bacterium]